jgi:hypothetical protein
MINRGDELMKKPEKKAEQKQDWIDLDSINERWRITERRMREIEKGLYINFETLDKGIREESQDKQEKCTGNHSQPWENIEEERKSRPRNENEWIYFRYLQFEKLKESHKSEKALNEDFFDVVNIINKYRKRPNKGRLKRIRKQLDEREKLFQKFLSIFRIEKFKVKAIEKLAEEQLREEIKNDSKSDLTDEEIDRLIDLDVNIIKFKKYVGAIKKKIERHEEYFILRAFKNSKDYGQIAESLYPQIHKNSTKFGKIKKRCEKIIEKYIKSQNTKKRHINWI